MLDKQFLNAVTSTKLTDPSTKIGALGLIIKDLK